MPPRRQRMVEDRPVRNLSPPPPRAYLETVPRFARHVGRSPASLGPEPIRAYQVDLTQERTLAPRSLGIAACARRFLDQVTLKRPWQWDTVIPAPTTPVILPAVLSPDEVVHLLAGGPHPAHRTILTTGDATGRRMAEAVARTGGAIDRQRMVLRGEDGQGHQDRCVLRSPPLRTILRAWWRVHRPPPWRFPGKDPARPLPSHAVREAAQRAHHRSRMATPIHPHSLRHALAVHLRERGPDMRTMQLLLGHRRLETTARYLRLATPPVCATVRPLDVLPRPGPAAVTPPPPASV